MERNDEFEHRNVHVICYQIIGLSGGFTRAADPPTWHEQLVLIWESATQLQTNHVTLCFS